MSLKNWILHGVHRMNGLAARGDLPEPRVDVDSSVPPQAASGAAPARAERGKRVAAMREPTLASAEHLGAYAPLIDAIRDELEHFVASHVRLHLAIAERDRFLLTAVGIGCESSEEARHLLQQFVREFKPEQVKRYLAREVIGGLPNAAAIDLSQFAGLFDADAARVAEEEAEGGEYRELLEALRAKPGVAALPGYRVSVLGRWVELDAGARPVAPMQASTSVPPAAVPGTPLAGQRCEFDVEDGGGRRRVVLHGVMAGRRYVVGNGEGADIRVEGTFASRRHAEVWLENGGWWVVDAGSTNGVRIEPAGPLQRGAAASRRGPGERVPVAGLASRTGQRLDGDADRHRERNAADAAHRDHGGARRARPGDADDADPAGGAGRERVPADALAGHGRAQRAADAGLAAGERRPLAAPDAGRRSQPRRRLRASPRHRRDRSPGQLRRRRPRRQRRDDRRRAARRGCARNLAARAEARARGCLALGPALRA